MAAAQPDLPEKGCASSEHLQPPYLPEKGCASSEHLQPPYFPVRRCASNDDLRPDMSEEGNGEKDEGLTMTSKPKASLNLVLFGRRGSGKTSAAKAILGQTDLPSASNSSECVRNQGEVHGRLVSVVELPALNGKAQQEVIEESFRCISLCDPEGVHAFILVLPVGPLTDEDKGELQTIQDTFSSRVNDFTMILFTTESDPTDPNFIETDRNIQELLQGCGGRYVVLNIKDSQQIPELMEKVEMINEQSRSFSKDVFTRILIERTLKLEAELQDVESKSEEEGEDEPQSIEPQRKETDVKEKDEEKKKHRDEIKALQAKLEQERKQKIQLLKEKESMKKECEKIKKEREEEERKWKRKEESQRKEWQQKVGALEKQKEAAEKKLEQSRREWVREREALEKEKDQIWERMHEELKENLQETKMNLEEERKSHRQLQEDYYRKRRKWTYVWFASLVVCLVLFYLYQSR